jgi:hypothetical protein
MTPYEKTELLRAFDHQREQVLLNKLDMLEARLQSVTKERDAALSEIARLTKELSVCNECAGKHLERAEKEAIADDLTIR